MPGPPLPGTLVIIKKYSNLYDGLDDKRVPTSEEMVDVTMKEALAFVIAALDHWVYVLIEGKGLAWTLFLNTEIPASYQVRAQQLNRSTV
jgi:hypothetical protein